MIRIFFLQKFRKISQVHIRKKKFQFFHQQDSKNKKPNGSLYKNLKVHKTFSLDEVHVVNNIELSLNLYVNAHMIQHSLGRPHTNIGLVFISGHNNWLV